MIMSNSWYHMRDGAQYGPYDLEEIREMLARGRFGEGDYFSSKGYREWLNVDQLRDQLTALERWEVASSTSYTVLTNDAQLGPLTQSELNKLVESGELEPDARVIRDDWRETVPISRIAQFARHYFRYISEQNLESEGFVDLTGDGIVDTVWFDTSGDGIPDTFLTDLTGDGNLDVVLTDVLRDSFLDTSPIEVVMSDINQTDDGLIESEPEEAFSQADEEYYAADDDADDGEDRVGGFFDF
jgi:hypothetical protein